MSTQDMNALEAQHIKGAFFFSRRHFEWDICYFSFNHYNGESCLQFDTESTQAFVASPNCEILLNSDYN